MYVRTKCMSEVCNAKICNQLQRSSGQSRTLLHGHLVSISDPEPIRMDDSN